MRKKDIRCCECGISCNDTFMIRPKGKKSRYYCSECIVKLFKIWRDSDAKEK